MRDSMTFRSAIAVLALGAAAWASHAREVVVAQVAPFGGPLAISGRDFNLGAMIAFDEANASGATGGHRIRLVSRDDGYRSSETVRHVTEVLASEQPVALIGMWGAENIEAVIDRQLLDTAQVPMVGIRSGVAALRKQSNIFHLRASYRDEVQRILQQVRTMGSSRVAVFYEDDAMGREAWADTRQDLEAAGLQPVAVAAQPRNDVQVEGAVATIARANAQAILVVANTPVAAAAIRALRARQVPAFIFATSTVDAEQLVTQLGKEAGGVAVAQGVPNPYKATVPVAMQFRQRVEALGIDASRINFASLEGYIAARVVVEAIRRSGKNPGPRDVTRALETLQRTDIGGFQIHFAPGQREGSRYVDLSMVSSDGRIRQ